MFRRSAAILVVLLAAGTLAFAQDSANKPAASGKAAAKGRPAKTLPIAHVASAPADAVERDAAARHGKNARDSHRHGKEETTSVTPTDRDPPALPLNFSVEAVGWRLVEDPATGARLGLPGKLVPQVGASRTGSRWTSAQGQIQIETFRLTEAALPALFEQEKKASRREIASSQLKPDSFVISGMQSLKHFSVRAVARGSEVRGVIVLYDQATEGTMENVAAAVIGAYNGFPDPQAAPMPGMRRMVEYGTAIVVSREGDLIAPAYVTDDCQSITLPGLGHGERVAADKASDLALIRVYGAHDLVPAALAESGSNDAEFKLVGVADPLTQAGAAEVTSVAARRTAQGVEPTPKPGFSGAAVVDSRGVLAGMVDLKPPVVASGGTANASQGVSLISVAAIRAFLQAHGVTPAVASDHPPLEQSVVRVACVRK